MKILISGGTGFLGQAITKALLQKGHSVRILSRSKKKNADAVVGDITDPQTLLPVLQGMEAVVQCAQFPGHPVENRRKGHTYWQVDAMGTQNLVNAARQANIKYFLYISGAGTGPDKKEPWFKAKWHAEEALRKSGLPHTILRPSWIYGPQDKSLNRIIQAARWLPIIGIIGDGKNRVRPLFIHDLAKLVASGFENESARGKTFEVGGPEEMTMKEMLQRTFKTLKLKRLLFSIPKRLLKFVWNPNAVDFITMDVSVDIAALMKVFPRLKLKTLEEGLKNYIFIPLLAAAIFFVACDHSSVTVEGTADISPPPTDSTNSIPLTENNWDVAYTGYGSVTFNNGILTLAPKVGANSTEHHSALVLSHTTQNCRVKNFDLIVSAATTQQYFQPPSPWHLFWIFFNTIPQGSVKTTNYFILKTNGVELGKAFGAADQIFLYTADNPKVQLGKTVKYEIKKVDTSVTVSIDGTPLFTYNNKSSAGKMIYDQPGSIGLYTEDSVSQISQVELKSLDNPTCP